MSQIPLQRPPDIREIDAIVALLNNTHYAQAEQKIRGLLAAHPQYGLLWKLFAAALQKQAKDAVPALRKTMELLPEDPTAPSDLGSALYARGEWAAALASWRRALALQPRNEDALLGSGDALRELRQPRNAVPFYQQALRLNSRLLEAHNNLGNAYLELAELDPAVQCYYSALQVSPDEASILCNLSNALRQLGRLPEARTTIQRAIALDPGISFAHNNLGLIEALQGQRDAAVASFRRALALQPGYIEALNNLGNVLRELGDREGALDSYSRALQLDPRRAESHCNLGSVLLELRRVDVATESFRRALTLQPEYPVALLGLALAQRQSGHAVQAEASCRAALTLQPDLVAAMALLGELRADRGEFAAAEQSFRQVLQIDPGSVAALNGIASNRRMTAADGDWQHQAEALLTGAPLLGDEITLRFALGKYWDDQGRYDAAFHQFRQANDLTKRYRTVYDRSTLSRRIDAIMQRFDGARAPGYGAHASDSQVPVFVVGMPRSGTSLTEQILASHPMACGAGELRFWEAAFDAQAARTAELAPAYLRRLTANARPATRVIDKMPANFLYAGLIHAVFPRAKIIHMRRHPIDTCLSIYFQHFSSMGPYANDLGNLAHYYREYLRLTAHWHSVLPPDTLLQVPYEGLVEDLEGWTRRMLAFIGLAWNPACLDFHLNDRPVLTASRWQVRQKINPDAVGRWRHYRDFLGPLRELDMKAS